MAEVNHVDEGSEDPRRRMNCWKRTRELIAAFWKGIFMLSWPLVLSPLLFILDSSSDVRCAYVVLLMAGYWVVECLPIAITSLIPVVLFPLFGILGSAETCSCYMNDTIMVFIGGLVLALAVQHSKLHLRIALGVMRAIGCSHARLLAGVCTVTTLLSMWISNTAATAMMLPIIFAILDEFERAGLASVFERRSREAREDVVDDGGDVVGDVEPTNVTRGYLMAAAFCATFGGTGTLVGTGTNLTFKGIYESTFPRSPGLSFTDWIVASFPQMLVNSFLTWLYIRFAYMGLMSAARTTTAAARSPRTAIEQQGESVASQVVERRYRELGPKTFHETAVAGLFALCVVLWIFRKPGFVSGWSELITSIEVKDSAPVILVSAVLFVVPKNPNFMNTRGKFEGLITWRAIESQMPWSLMFLLGGGFAIAKGTSASLLGKRIGEALVPLRFLPPLLLLAIVCLFVGTLTEFTSNVGVANITLPVIAQMCVAMRIHPLYLMIPATLMCSFSFRLPVGTPPNAIITVQGRISTKNLMVGGCVPAMYSLIVQLIFFPTWATYVYGIDRFPEWAVAGNATEGQG